MLRHSHSGDIVPPGQGDQGLSVTLVQRVEECPPRRVSECPEDPFHTTRIGNQMVSCQGLRTHPSRQQTRAPPTWLDVWHRKGTHKARRRPDQSGRLGAGFRLSQPAGMLSATSQAARWLGDLSCSWCTPVGWSAPRHRRRVDSPSGPRTRPRRPHRYAVPADRPRSRPIRTPHPRPTWLRWCRWRPRRTEGSRPSPCRPARADRSPRPN